jgi:hypothetical protein
MFDILYEQVTSNSRGKNVWEHCYGEASIPPPPPLICPFSFSMPLAGISSLQDSTVCLHYGHVVKIHGVKRLHKPKKKKISVTFVFD